MKYEYLAVAFRVDAVTAELNKLGNEGWLLVSATFVTPSFHCVLMRQLPTDAAILSK